MSRVTYKNTPTPIAVNRMLFDKKSIEESKEVVNMEGLYFNFNLEGEIDTTYQQMIVGPSDSPYEGGFYLFRGQFPDQYPFHPMTMKSMTQGGGVRKHPNLYVCGKCCFSFLGTWHGPPWTACQNPKTVAASMRSVMIEFPLENEPGWEKIKDDRQVAYAKLIKFFNIKWAVCEIVENTPKEFMCFRNDIVSNFLKNYSVYLKNLSEFEDLDGYNQTSPTYGFSIKYDYYDTLDRLKNLYDKLSNVKPIHPSLLPQVTNLPESKNDDTKNANKSESGKKTKLKLIPNELAKNLDIGTKMKNSKGEMYIVSVQTRNGKPYNIWKKYKE